MHAWNKTVWWPCKSLVHYDIPVDGHVERLRLEVRSKLINLYTFTGSRRPTCSCASAPMRPRPPERSLWPSCRGWASTSLFLRSSLLLLQWLLSLSRGVYGLTCWFTTVGFSLDRIDGFTTRLFTASHINYRLCGEKKRKCFHTLKQNCVLVKCKY